METVRRSRQTFHPSFELGKKEQNILKVKQRWNGISECVRPIVWPRQERYRRKSFNRFKEFLLVAFTQRLIVPFASLLFPAFPSPKILHFRSALRLPGTRRGKCSLEDTGKSRECAFPRKALKVKQEEEGSEEAAGRSRYTLTRTTWS